MNLWWGYRHTCGSYQVKRYFGALDIQEANESDFVLVTFGPFSAVDRDHALKIIKEKI